MANTTDELFANNFSTTLNGAINNSVTSVVVNSAAPVALQGGQFRILVDSEYMLVTAGASTTTWTVTRGVEGSTAASHSSGAAVTHIVTAVSIVSVIPTGMITPYAGATAPVNWLLCDGAAVSRTTYAVLFTVVSTTYGVGNGSTTFNVPDLRQRLPLGQATSGTGSTLGGTGGAIDHSHTVNSHTHSISSDGSHSHTGNTGAPSATTTVNGNTPTVFVGDQNHTHTISSDGSHTHTGATGGATPGTNTQNPPFLAVNYIVKT